MTFPRSARLTRPRDFKRVFQSASRSGSDPVSASGDRYFKVLAGPGAGAGPRLGLAVSRKVDRRASVRNRIKRVIRESFRQRFARGESGWPAAPALDFVVLPRPACATISNAKLFDSLDRHWARIVAQFERAPVDRAHSNEPGPEEPVSKEPTLDEPVSEHPNSQDPISQKPGPQDKNP